MNLTDVNGTMVNITVVATVPYTTEWTGEVLFRVITLIFVMVLTSFGNTILISVLMCNRRQRRKRVNVFVINLAIGDLMVCFFTMTTEILFVAFGEEWVLGKAACKIIVYGQIVTLASTTFLLTGMAIDRYQVIVQPLQSLTLRPSIRAKVMAAWILAFIFAFPQLLIFVQTDEGLHPDGKMKHLCKSKGYTAEWQRKMYISFLTLYILVLPMMIMSFCYYKIIRVVWSRTNGGGATRQDNNCSVGPGEESNNSKGKFTVKFKSYKSHNVMVQENGSDVHTVTLPLPKEPNRRSATSTTMSGSANGLVLSGKLFSSSKRKVIKMTLSIILGFLICWSPYFVFSLIRIFSDYRIKVKVGLMVAEVLTLVHSALNPLLYVIFSSKLFNKETFTKVMSFDFTCWTRRKSAQDDSQYGSMNSDDDSVWCEGGHNIYIRPCSSNSSQDKPMLKGRKGRFKKMAIIFSHHKSRGCKSASYDSYDVYVTTSHRKCRDLPKVNINVATDCPCAPPPSRLSPSQPSHYSDSIIFQQSTGKKEFYLCAGHSAHEHSDLERGKSVYACLDPNDCVGGMKLEPVRKKFLLQSAFSSEREQLLGLGLDRRRGVRSCGEISCDADDDNERTCDKKIVLSDGDYDAYDVTNDAEICDIRVFGVKDGDGLCNANDARCLMSCDCQSALTHHSESSSVPVIVRTGASDCVQDNSGVVHESSL